MVSFVMSEKLTFYHAKYFISITDNLLRCFSHFKFALTTTLKSFSFETHSTASVILWTV